MSVPSLSELLIAKAARPQPPRLRLSLAGLACVRELFYRATGAEAEPTKPEGLLKMALGTGLDALLLSGEAGGWRFQVPVTVTLGGLSVQGTADAVWFDENGEPAHVADLKTVGSTTWAKVQKEPKQEHRAQCQLYAYGLGAATWSVCYVNADTGERLEHFGQTDAFTARRDFGAFEEAAYWMGRGEPPPRPYEDIEEEDGTVKVARDRFPCAWCAYKATCWPGRSKEDEQPVQAA